jgi:hypothetical protein
VYRDDDNDVDEITRVSDNDDDNDVSYDDEEDKRRWDEATTTPKKKGVYICVYRIIIAIHYA